MAFAGALHPLVGNIIACSQFDDEIGVERRVERIASELRRDRARRRRMMRDHDGRSIEWPAQFFFQEFESGAVQTCGVGGDQRAQLTSALDPDGAEVLEPLLGDRH